jgi:hypothetical protein
MSSLSQLLTDILIRLPHSFENSSLVTWMNDYQNKIWPHCCMKDSYEFTTVSDQSVYTLPAYIKIQYIKNIFIADDLEADVDDDTVWTEYFYKRPNEELSGYKFYDVLGSLGIYPAPETTGLAARIIAKTKPDALSSDDLDAIPDIDSDFHDILKYECWRIISESPPYEDVLRAKYYEEQRDKIFELILERELRYKINMEDKPQPNAWWLRKWNNNSNDPTLT